MAHVEQILREMPAQERSTIAEDRVLELERELGDEEILIFARCHSPIGTLVITPTRIINLLQDGGVDVTSFADVASLTVIQGRKKLFGGHAGTTFSTELRDGTKHKGQIGTDGTWGARTGEEMGAAYRTFAMAHWRQGLG